MAQANYPACVAFVAKQEGGNTDTPGDHGGRTGRGGITHTIYDAYRVCKGLPLQDVFKISDQEIAEIYQDEYWNPIYGDRLPAGQDLALFDYAINSGPAKANELRMLAGNGDVQTLIHKICAERLSFVHSLGSWKQFGATWGKRVAECEATALAMAGMLSPSTADSATQAQDAQKKKSARVITGSIFAAGAASHFGHVSLWAIITILIVGGLGAAVAIYNAWRQGQRGDALNAAIRQMQATQAAAATARASVAQEVSAKEQTIYAEQAALAAAKATIDIALSGSPLPPTAPTPPLPPAQSSPSASRAVPTAAATPGAPPTRTAPNTPAPAPATK